MTAHNPSTLLILTYLSAFTLGMIVMPATGYIPIDPARHPLTPPAHWICFGFCMGIAVTCALTYLTIRLLASPTR